MLWYSNIYIVPSPAICGYVGTILFLGAMSSNWGKVKVSNRLFGAYILVLRGKNILPSPLICSYMGTFLFLDAMNSNCGKTKWAAVFLVPFNLTLRTAMNHSVLLAWLLLTVDVTAKCHQKEFTGENKRSHISLNHIHKCLPLWHNV